MKFAIYREDTGERISEIFATEREAIDARNALQSEDRTTLGLFVEIFPRGPLHSDWYEPR